MESVFKSIFPLTISSKEHFLGDLNYDYQNGDWDTCLAGVNAKDTTDAITGNIQLINTYMADFVPSNVWDPNAQFERSYDNLLEKNSEFINRAGFHIG